MTIELEKDKFLEALLEIHDLYGRMRNRHDKMKSPIYVFEDKSKIDWTEPRLEKENKALRKEVEKLETKILPKLKEALGIE